MIVQESNGRVLVCSICDGKHPVYRNIAENPESLLLEKERITRDHLECTKYPHDAPRARRERASRKRTEKAARLLNTARLGIVR